MLLYHYLYVNIRLLSFRIIRLQSLFFVRRRECVGCIIEPTSTPVTQDDYIYIYIV